MLMFLKVQKHLIMGSNWKDRQNINRVAVINALELAAVQSHENSAFVVVTFAKPLA